MENIIKSEKGFFTIIERFGKDFKIEMLDPNKDNSDVLYVEYSSIFFVLGDEDKVENLFKEFEMRIIKIMKFFINENIEFYKHFDIDFALIGKSFCYTLRGDFTSNYYHINWSRFLSSELKKDSLEYLKGLTDE